MAGESQVFRKEGEKVGHNPAVRTPCLFAPPGAVFFGLIGHTIFVEHSGKGLVGDDMIVVTVISPPVELEGAQAFQIAGVPVTRDDTYICNEMMKDTTRPPWRTTRLGAGALANQGGEVVSWRKDQPFTAFMQDARKSAEPRGPALFILSSNSVLVKRARPGNGRFQAFRLGLELDIARTRQIDLDLARSVDVGPARAT